MRLKNLLVLILTIWVWGISRAEDNLVPKNEEQSVAEYEDFLKTGQWDPGKLTVWRMRIMKKVQSGYGHDGYYVCYIDPKRKDYLVMVSWNNLYNFFHTLPPLGGSILVEGSLRSWSGKATGQVDGKTVNLNTVLMQPTRAGYLNGYNWPESRYKVFIDSKNHQVQYIPISPTPGAIPSPGTTTIPMPVGSVMMATPTISRGPR